MKHFLFSMPVIICARCFIKLKCMRTGHYALILSFFRASARFSRYLILPNSFHKKGEVYFERRIMTGSEEAQNIISIRISDVLFYI